MARHQDSVKRLLTIKVKESQGGGERLWSLQTRGGRSAGSGEERLVSMVQDVADKHQELLFLAYLIM